MPNKQTGSLNTVARHLRLERCMQFERCKTERIMFINKYTIRRWCEHACIITIYVQKEGNTQEAMLYKIM